MTSTPRTIAEHYLKEMLQADDSANFELYTRRYEKRYLGGFTEERFHRDIKGMHERNGMNEGYEFLGELRSATFDGIEVHRTVWRGIYEKRDAVIEIGVYEREGEWFVIQSTVH